MGALPVIGVEVGRVQMEQILKGGPMEKEKLYI